ncbi:solute carrier family 15 member 5 [Labeo rohita]|uniref:Solute carrier family 15 member 5 n=1 Tax=Labeo rohita TaxID=84645 RepID=A0A498MDJ8_LABRO|nr:solute carrier family 15 member 5 [Labeo rohita]
MLPVDAFDTHNGHWDHGICTSSYHSGTVSKPKERKKLQVIVCVLFVELFERFTFFGIVCNMILFCTIKLGYSSYQAAMVNTCFVGASVLTPVLVGWFAETCLGRTTVLCFCALLHFFGTALLPVVAFPFEDFYINTHNIVHRLEPHEQHILFYTALVAVALGIGGIRAILCPMAAYHLQGCDQHKLLSFFNWFYWLVNLNSTIVFLGIAYIQQSVAKNLCFLIPFTSVLLALIAIHMVRNKLTFRPKKAMGHACAALSALLAGISEIHRKDYPQVEQTLSGKVLHVSSMTCFQLTPQYVLLGVAEAFVTPACSLISFCLTPSNLRGVSLHFLTLSYGGGCFLGAFLIHFLYFVSGGNFYPNNLSNGNMERFFFTLATLMAINTLVFWRISQRYADLSVELSSGVGQSILYEKLLQYKTCLRFYDTLDRSDTMTSMETVL